MTYFLIAVVVMAALSPLISMMPTRRQREIADRRQRALSCGMTVQLRELPGAAGSGELLPFYGRPRSRANRRATGTAVYRREGERWSSSAGATPAPLLTLFEQLPGGVSHVCDNVQDVGLFWDERGVDADVVRIDAVLQQLLQASELQEN